MAYDFNSLIKQADEASNRDKFYTDFEDVDPNVLHQISELTDWMRTKAKGSDVREVIAQLFERTWLEESKKGNANMEVAKARGRFPVLNDRLNNADRERAENARKLAQKANKDEVTNVMTPKGTLASASLPTSGNQVGWYYYCPDGDGTHGAGNYVWNGTSWYFGGTGDEGYNLLKEDLGELYKISPSGNYYNDDTSIIGKSIDSGTGQIRDDKESKLSRKISMDFSKTIIASGSNYSGDNNYLYCYGNNDEYLGRVACKNGAILSETYPNIAYVLFPSLINDTKCVITYTTDVTYREYNPISGYINESISEFKNKIHNILKYNNDGNLYNVNEIKKADINSGTGIITDNNDYFISNKIFADFTTPIIISGAYTGDGYNMYAYCFNENDEYLGRVNCINSAILSDTYNNISYIYVCGKVGIHENTIMVEYGKFPRKYESAEYYLSSYEKPKNKIIDRNRDKESYVSAISHSDSIYNSSSDKDERHKYLTILQISDSHGNHKTVKNAIDFADYYSDIDCVLHNGDYQHYNYFDNKEDNGFKDTVLPYATRSIKPFYPVIGNHDVGNHKVAPCSKDDVYKYYINSLVDQMDLDSNFGRTPYYYKDFEQYKIRMIVLCEYETPRDLVSGSDNTYKADMWKRFISQEQASWFANILKSTNKNNINGLPDDWHVIVALHQLAYEPDIDTLNNPFSYRKAKVGWKLDAGSWKSNQDNTLITDIVDTFISKTTLTKTYDVLDDSGLPSTYAVNLSLDYSDRNNSNFICFLSGHTHMDIVGYVKGMNNNVINISIADSSFANEAVYGDLPRTDGAKSEDCLNVISFDTEERKIKIVRIGADMTCEMQERKYTSISY